MHTRRFPHWPRTLGGAALRLLTVAAVAAGVTAALPAAALAQTCVDPQAVPLGVTQFTIPLGNVRFQGALSPAGAPLDLDIRDDFPAALPDGLHEVGVAWSDAAAQRFASMLFPVSLFGDGPHHVAVLCSHNNSLELRAYDRTNALVGVVAHPGPVGTLKNLVLNAAQGIRRIEIVGIDIGIQEVCFDSPAFAPGSGCIGAAGLPVLSSGHVFQVDGVDVEAAFDNAGLPLNVAVSDFLPAGAADGVNEFNFSWSLPAAGAPSEARIRFPAATFGDGPTTVEVVCAPSNNLELTAYDKVGAPLMTVVHAAGVVNLEVLTLTGGPIREVRLRGPQFWVSEVCWEGAVLPAPLLECADLQSLPAGGLGSMIDVDDVVFRSALDPGGAAVNLVADDRFDLGGNGILELDIPWSNAGAQRFAQIIFPPAQFGRGVTYVEMKSSHNQALSIEAYDRFGALVDLDVHPGPVDTWRTLAVSNAECIRRIDIHGALIGIEELCFERSPADPGSGYTGSTLLAPVGAVQHLWSSKGVEVEAAFDPAGAPLGIALTDDLPASAPEALGEFFFDWSRPGIGASRTARIRFPSTAFGAGPTSVEILCAPSATLNLVAYDDLGAVVQTATHGAGVQVLEAITLGNGTTPLRQIELIGVGFWVTDIGWSGLATSTGTERPAAPLALSRLRDPAPNPFNPRTSVSFSLAQAGPVRLDVLDLRGRRVAQLVGGQLPEGEHRVTWNGDDDAGRSVASGTYLFRLQAGGQVLVRRGTLAK